MLISFVLLASCSDDNEIDKSVKPDGIFIEVNKDIRQPSLVNETGYKIDISSGVIFFNNYGEVSGTIFEMNIQDENRKYIGGIADITSCVEIRIAIVVFDRNIENNSNYKTILIEQPDSLQYNYDIDLEAVKDKCIVKIDLLDDENKIILEGYSIENQTLSIKKETGEYYIEFFDFIFKAKTDSFTASSRIITN